MRTSRPKNPKGEADPKRPWVIRIHPWLYNAIVRQGDILAVHPDYFQLTGGIERWLYRLARKAVPDKAEPPVLKFKMETLHARSGVTNTLRRFALDIRKIAERQLLPEYGIDVEYRKRQSELVTLYRDKAKPGRPPRGRRLKTIEGEPIKPVVITDIHLEEEPPLTIVPETIVDPDSLPAITPRPTVTVEHTDQTAEPPSELTEEEEKIWRALKRVRAAPLENRERFLLDLEAMLRATNQWPLASIAINSPDGPIVLFQHEPDDDDCPLNDLPGAIELMRILLI